MTREQARAEINSRPLTDFYPLERSRNGASNQYVCPICNSGTGGNHSGALTLYPDSKRLYCFACGDTTGTFGGKGQDTLGALRLLWNCSETEAIEKAGYSIDKPTGSLNWDSEIGSSKSKKSHRTPTDSPQVFTSQTIQSTTQATQTALQGLTEQLTDYTEYYKQCRERLRSSPEAISYLQARGISIETANAYSIGFDAEWSSPTARQNGKNPPVSSRLILPTCSTHYVARDISPTAKPQFAKMNEGKPSIFNLNAIYDSSKEAIFVTEGYFDALSIIEAGANAIALNSTSNANKLIDLLQRERIQATLILCLDNDGAGQKATETLKGGLQRLNISYVTADICNGYKDPNEALQANRATFSEAIRTALNQTSARPDNISTYIDTLMSGDIDKFRENKDRKTGFQKLDAQSKGLYAGLYVVGAISSLGKTTFCHQMADQLATAGEDVLFFSLEQSRLELVSKSFSRRTAQKDVSTAVNSLSIRRGYLPKNVLEVAKEYKRDIGDRLSIIEGNFACDISFIGDYIRKYIQKTGKKPVVFIDYLQILQPVKDDRGRVLSIKETIDSTVTELKRISREHQLTIFVISSLNRTNYLSPVDFESFKESGGIEYTADVVWGLQLQCMNSGLFDKKDGVKAKRELVRLAKKANPRKIELLCLKNRYGISSFSCYFDYYPEFDLFKEGKLSAEFAVEEEQPQKKAGRKR
ncbi:MAG: toprim domain-containing protein [Ruminococcus sp.]|nr:toprim domain-containing protein [Ruminococcus sp.]